MIEATSYRAFARLAPYLATAFLALTTALILASAGSTLGYDYQAYAGAAHRVLDGRPLYDPAVDVAGGFAIYLYPPPFALATLPFAILPSSAGMWAWLGGLFVAFLAGVALMPVRASVRWAVVFLAALDWPFLYSMKLGQVGPLLILIFAAAWRWIDRPAREGLSAAIGALVKVQPGLLLVWAAATRRWRAVAWGVGVLAVAVIVSSALFGTGVWGDYLSLLGRVNEPVTTPHNFTPGAIAYQLGASANVAGVIQLASTGLAVAVVVIGWLRAESSPSLIATIVASQLVSPLLWDHYAVVLLLPVAYLLERRQWWAIAIPLVCWLPAPVYPVVFWICLVAPLVVGRQATPATRTAMA